MTPPRSFVLRLGCLLLSACAGSSSSDAEKRIFVASTEYDGTLGGLSGGDAKCNTVATGAAIGGTWKAWLSDDTTNALDRITEVGPWYRVDGVTLVANNKTTLTTTLINSIAFDERGLTTGTTPAWTGTLPDGSSDVDNCANWASNATGTSGTVGNPNGVGGEWTKTTVTYQCSQEIHIYCIEQ